MIQLLKHRLSIHLNISLPAGPALSCPLTRAAAASPCSEVPDSEPPKSLLSGDPLDAFAILPDIHSGYYQFLRLDRSGVVNRPLKDTGNLSIATAVYSCNFLIFDGQPTSPGMTIRFPFKPVSEASLGDPVEIKGRHITYKEELNPRQRVAGYLKGYSTSASEPDHH
ncbi:MAG TPA: hypothetical protein VIM60_00275 [Edaphobacter sp.]